MKIKQISTRIITFGAAAGLALAASSAIAQPGQGQAQQAPQQQQEQIELNDEMLNQFADALGGISEIRTEYSAAIGEAEDPNEAQSLQQEAQTKMVEVVEESGLDVSTYNLIAQRLQTDPELQERVQEMM